MLEDLIRRVYVDGGFTHPNVATTLFAGASVRRRGTLLFLRDANRSLVGTVIVVAPDSPARRIATAGEAEMQLLAVSPERRSGGLGRILVDAALRRTRQEGYCRMVLWTQPTMHSAHRLYERASFLSVIEGACTILFGGKRIELRTGQELVIPQGTPQSVEAVAGTRTMRVFGGNRARRESVTDPQGATRRTHGRPWPGSITTNKYILHTRGAREDVGTSTHLRALQQGFAAGFY